MIEHFALRFCDAYGKLWRHLDALLALEKEHKPKPLQDRKLSDSRTRFMAEDGLAPIMAEMDRLDFDKALRDKTKLLFARMADGSRSWTAELLFDSIRDIRRDICLELGKHKFAYIRSPNDQYFDQERLFGDQVYQQCESARQDVRDAGNSFAAELYAATVFYLMRVAEHGLRALAKQVRATIKDKNKRVPIEFGDWNKVITAINKKIEAARQLPAGPKKQARLHYYSDAAQHCLFMKDIYRNDMAHARKPYTEAEASTAMQRVREFMQFLTRAIPR
jgi:hypothetical protein